MSEASADGVPEPDDAVADRIDVALVRRLVAEQFPQWAHLPVRPVEVDGWDNRRAPRHSVRSAAGLRTSIRHRRA